MLELEENNKLLTDLKNRLKQIGDSLWHHFIREIFKRTRRENNAKWFLEWCGK